MSRKYLVKIPSSNVMVHVEAADFVINETGDLIFLKYVGPDYLTNVMAFRRDFWCTVEEMDERVVQDKDGFTIRECHWNENNGLEGWTDAISPYGETREELIQELERMLHVAKEREVYEENDTYLRKL